MYLVIYIHGTKRIRSPTSYSAKQESFALYKRGAHSELRPCTATHIRGLFFPGIPRIQTRTAPGGRYLCPSGFLTSALSKVRTRLLPLNERKRFVRSRAGTRFTWILHRDTLNRIIMGFAWQDSRDTDRISRILILKIRGASRQASESPLSGL